MNFDDGGMMNCSSPARMNVSGREMFDSDSWKWRGKILDQIYRWEARRPHVGDTVRVFSSGAKIKAYEEIIMKSAENEEALSYVETTDLAGIPTEAISADPNETHRHRPSRNRKEDGGPRLYEENVPLQTVEDAGLLFDALAPHLEQKVLKALSVRMRNFSKESFPQGEIGGNGAPLTLIGRVDSIFDDTRKRSRNKKKSHHRKRKRSRTLMTLESHPWMKPLLTQFFVGDRMLQEGKYDFGGMAPGAGREDSRLQDEHATPNTAVDAALWVWSDPTYPPNLNRQNFDQNVATLMKAREVSVKHPLFWTSRQQRKQKRLLKRKMRRTASKPKGQKSESEVEASEKEGGEFSHDRDDQIQISESSQLVKEKEDLQNAVPPSSVQLDAALSDQLVKIHGHKSTETLRAEAEAVVSILADCLPTCYYDQLLEMFDVYASSEDSESDGSAIGNLRLTEGLDTSPSQTSSRMRLLFPNVKNRARSHVHLVASCLAEFFYIDMSSLSGSDLGSQKNGSSEVLDSRPSGSISFDLHEARKEREAWNIKRESVAQSFLESQHSFVSPQQSPEDVVPLNEQVASQQQILEKVPLKEQMADTIEELDELRTRPSDGVKIGGDRAYERKQGKQKKNLHLVFDALMLKDTWGPTTVASDRMVFIDNLPIDIDESELTDLYSRCGPVESVQIFNRRPDLDPGDLSRKKVAEMRRKSRLSMSSRRKGHGRNRTPVYGVITFATEGGYDSATDAPLSIFGMVIRRHAVRSVRARDMTRLYIENIPPGFYSLDIEVKLSRELHPDITVCLDMGHHDYSEPSSCEIKFPSFDMAYHAFMKLREVDMGSEDAALNWMRTPENAQGYWCREIGF